MNYPLKTSGKCRIHTCTNKLNSRSRSHSHSLTHTIAHAHTHSRSRSQSHKRANAYIDLEEVPLSLSVVVFQKGSSGTFKVCSLELKIYNSCTNKLLSSYIIIGHKSLNVMHYQVKNALAISNLRCDLQILYIPALFLVSNTNFKRLEEDSYNVVQNNVLFVEENDNNTYTQRSWRLHFHCNVLGTKLSWNN